MSTQTEPKYKLPRRTWVEALRAWTAGDLTPKEETAVEALIGDHGANPVGEIVFDRDPNLTGEQNAQIDRLLPHEIRELLGKISAHMQHTDHRDIEDDLIWIQKYLDGKAVGTIRRAWKKYIRQAGQWAPP